MVFSDRINFDIEFDSKFVDTSRTLRFTRPQKSSSTSSHSEKFEKEEISYTLGSSPS